MEYQTEDAHQPEKSVIGAILISPQKVYEVMTLLDAGDFTLTHGRIYEACVAIANRGGLPDISAVANHLRGFGAREKVGGIAYLSECCDSEAMGLCDTCKQVRVPGHFARCLGICESKDGAPAAGRRMVEKPRQAGRSVLGYHRAGDLSGAPQIVRHTEPEARQSERRSVPLTTWQHRHYGRRLHDGDTRLGGEDGRT